MDGPNTHAPESPAPALGPPARAPASAAQHQERKIRMLPHILFSHISPSQLPSCVMSRVDVRPTRALSKVTQTRRPPYRAALCMLLWLLGLRATSTESKLGRTLVSHSPS